MPEGTTINLFVKGVKPVWEDPEHKQGASFRLQFSKGYANQIWEDLVLALIGEQFELENEVTGIVLSIGRTDKISVWFRHGYDNRVAPKIKADMIRLLGLPQDVKTSVSIFFPQNAPNKQHRERDTRQRRDRDLTSYSSTTAKPAPTQESKATVGIDELLE